MTTISILCESDGCGYEFATVHETEAGSALRTATDHKLRLLVTEAGKKGELICPLCDHHTPTDLEFWKRWDAPVEAP